MANNKPSRLTVRRDDSLDADLSTVMRTGMTQTDATKWALHMAAQALAWMWDAGHVEPGKLPPFISFRVPARKTPDQRV